MTTAILFFSWTAIASFFFLFPWNAIAALFFMMLVVLTRLYIEKRYDAAILVGAETEND